MTTRDEARLSMYQSVMDFLLKNTGTTEPLPNFASLFLVLQKNIESILKIVQEQNRDKSGFTVNKKTQHDEIVIRTTNLAGKMVAYATVENDNELLNKIKFSKSDLTKSTDNDLVTHAFEVCDNAATRLESLTAYIVTEEEIAGLRELCSVFLENIAKPAESRRDTRQATQALTDLLKGTDKILMKLDAIMLILRYSDTAFYDHYISSRTIVNTGARSLAVNGTITDAVTGKGLAGVTVVFEPVNGTADKTKAGGDLQKNVKITAAKGGFKIKTLEAGSYLVTATKEGYAPQSLTIYVNKGELSLVNTALQPL